MSGPQSNVIEVDGRKVELRNPGVAAFLAWLVPGAGHLYQRRYAKAALLSLCIFTTYFLGFAIGGGRVVYASWNPGDRRWHYLCQVAVGLPALPALVQAYHMRQYTTDGRTDWDYEDNQLWDGFMAPPRQPVREDEPEDLADWHAEVGAGYELGTWYTMIAGLLNVLAIYDAYAGPLAIPISGRSERSPEEEPSGGAGERKKKKKTEGG